MEKMIAVINDNLRSVVNGIKEHKLDMETALSSIADGINQKIKAANNYKNEVINSRVIISSLEDEITSLENDLDELKKKFNSDDFKEILSAGNKEINAKINEKRAAISEQGRLITDLTEKAKILKDELIELREKKESTEDNLQKTKVLERYFELRINEIIDYSEAHAQDLDSYKKEIPQEELIVDDTYEQIDLDKIDDKVFEEIDEISLDEVDDKTILEVLSNPLESEIRTLDELEVEEPEIEELDVATTSELESMISEAKSIIDSHAEIINNPPVVEYVDEVEPVDGDLFFTPDKEKIEEISAPEEEIVKEELDLDDVESSTKEEEKTQTEISLEKKLPSLQNSALEQEDDVEVEELDIIEDAPEISPDDLVKIFNDSVKELEEEKKEVLANSDALDEDDDSIEIFVEDSTEAINPNKIIDFEGNVVSTKEEKPDARELHERLGKHNLSEPRVQEAISFDDVVPVVTAQIEPVMETNDFLANEPTMELSTDDVLGVINEDKEAAAELDAIQKEIEDKVKYVINEDEAINDENVITEENFEEFNFDDALVDCGLDKSLIPQNDLIVLEAGFDKKTVKQYLDYARKFGIEENTIYSNIPALVSVAPETLDRILDLLKSIGATSRDVNLIYGKIDKVNVNKLEQNIMASTNPIMTEVLYDAMNVEPEDVIDSFLGLSMDDGKLLKKCATKEEYAIMNIFPELVKENYEQVKKLNITNLNECICRHPHRFIYEPSKLFAILDKYDTDDLIRCINKNAAVIDKL